MARRRLALVVAVLFVIGCGVAIGGHDIDFPGMKCVDKDPPPDPADAACSGDDYLEDCGYVTQPGYGKVCVPAKSGTCTASPSSEGMKTRITGECRLKFPNITDCWCKEENREDIGLVKIPNCQ